MTNRRAVYHNLLQHIHLGLLVKLSPKRWKFILPH